MTDRNIVRSGTEVPTKGDERAVALPEAGPSLLPDVDIIESRDAIRLVTDLPGVDQQSVEVTVEADMLVIQAQAHVEEPPGYSLVRQDYTVGNFRREITLSAAVDSEGISARLERGVLELTLPKREESKTRTIRVDS